MRDFRRKGRIPWVVGLCERPLLSREIVEILPGHRAIDVRDEDIFLGSSLGDLDASNSALGSRLLFFYQAIECRC
jgi:hypothetical protein